MPYFEICRWLKARGQPRKPDVFHQVWSLTLIEPLDSFAKPVLKHCLTMSHNVSGLLGRGAIGGAAGLSPRALLPERQQPPQVRPSRYNGDKDKDFDGKTQTWSMFIGSDFDSFSNNFPAFRVTWFCAPTPGFKEISWDMIVWKPKSLSTSTQEHDVICRDSVNTGIAPEALVEDVIVREAYKVFLQNPLFSSNNVFHFGHMSTDSPYSDHHFNRRGTQLWSSGNQRLQTSLVSASYTGAPSFEHANIGGQD